MADNTLTQTEADELIALEKYRCDEEVWDYPSLGGSVSIPLQTADKRELFLLDIRRGRISLSKGTHQTRAHQTVILVRLDFGGPPHRNPNGEEIGPSHLHVYREGFGDKWAKHVPEHLFSNLDDHWTTLQEFMHYCNIVKSPNISNNLFT